MKTARPAPPADRLQKNGFLGLLGDSLAGLFRRKPSAFQPIGSAGTAVYGGYVNSAENSGDIATPSARYRTYSDNLANISIIGASVRLYLNLCGRATWTYEPAVEGDAQAEDIATFVEEVFGDMERGWRRVVKRAATSRLYGFSVQEWTAKRREDGRVGYLDIAPRAQRTIERWATDDAGRVVGMLQRDPQTQREIAIPRSKVLYLRDEELNDSPEGLGIFRHCVDPCKRLRRYEDLEGVGYDIDLRGMPVARAPMTRLAELENAGRLTPTQRAELLDPVRDFVGAGHIKARNRGLVLDSMVYESEGDTKTPSGQEMWGLDILQGSSSTEADIGRTILRINREIARLFGTEQLLVGDGAGAFALAKAKATQLGQVVDDTLREIAEGVKADLILPLMTLNGWDRDLAPTPKPELQHLDLEDVVGALEGLARSGSVMDPDDPAEDAVRDQAGLPRRPKMDMAEDAALGGSLGPMSEAESTEPDLEMEEA